ncbi:unnamed protein product, partial [Closterium sp. NIES-65]
MSRVCDRLVDVFWVEKPDPAQWRLLLAFSAEWARIRPHFFARAKLRAREFEEQGKPDKAAELYRLARRLKESSDKGTALRGNGSQGHGSQGGGGGREKRGSPLGSRPAALLSALPQVDDSMTAHNRALLIGGGARGGGRAGRAGGEAAEGLHGGTDHDNPQRQDGEKMRGAGRAVTTRSDSTVSGTRVRCDVSGRRVSESEGAESFEHLQRLCQAMHDNPLMAGRDRIPGSQVSKCVTAMDIHDKVEADEVALEAPQAKFDSLYLFQPVSTSLYMS